jgi:RNA polymerase sigma-70 factor (ECF subfamily)
MNHDAELKDRGEALHARLLSRDDICASSEIAETFLPRLSAALRRRFSSLPDPHLTDTAAVDALLQYLSHPERFDPSRGSLIGYLYMDAYGNAVDKLRRERRFVELSTSEFEHLLGAVGSHDPEAELVEAESPVVATALEAVTSQSDREMLFLMMEGVRETDEYARVLGIEHLSREERAATVKRHKDRLKVALRRRFKVLGGSR